MNNRIADIVDKIKQFTDFEPEIGIVLGSGLGGLAEMIQSPVIIKYGDLPHFPCSTAPDHAGQFVFGTLSGKKVVCMQGRVHYYEGHAASEIAVPVRTMVRLGIKTLVLTNAAGGVNTSFVPGDLMVIADHINYMGVNPLIGENDDSFGPRFCDMSNVYTKSLRDVIQKVAGEQGIDIKSGVYMAFTGPSFETPAEIRMARALGADAVGMSTVPEAIVASHCGLKLAAISMITNMAAGILNQPISGEEVIEMGIQNGKKMQSLISGVVELI